MVAARKAGLELHTFLDVLNSSSGVNFATLNRFPRIVDGDYLEGGLTGNLMLKDLRLYADLVRELDVRTLTAAGCVDDLRARRRARLRRPDLQPGRRRDRRRLRRGAAAGAFRPERIARMKINRGREPGTTSELRTANFTGEVWADPVLAETDGVLINNVFFAPGARTHWHTPSTRARSSSSRAAKGAHATRDGGGGKLTAGDVVWIPPGEEHWHGAAPGSSMLHLAISLGGHDWLDPVTDEEYEEGWDVSDRFEQGLAVRRAVLGAEYVDRSLEQALAVLAADAGARDGVLLGRGLDARGPRPPHAQPVNLGMLTALGQSHELGAHVRGAVTNGCTEEEIQEVLLQAAVYCGMPAGLEAFRVAEQAIEDGRR